MGLSHIFKVDHYWLFYAFQTRTIGTNSKCNPFLVRSYFICVDVPARSLFQFGSFLHGKNLKSLPVKGAVNKALFSVNDQFPTAAQIPGGLYRDVDDFSFMKGQLASWDYYDIILLSKTN